MLKKINYLNTIKYRINWCFFTKYKEAWALLVFLFAIAISLYSFAYFLEDQTREWMYEIEVKELGIQSDSIANFLGELGNSETPESINPYIARVGGSADYRVTILADDGDVIADSWLSLSEVEAMENHADRTEIAGSSFYTPGIAIRYSSTINKDMMYLARRYQKDGFSGYVRIARPSSILATNLKVLHEKLLQGVFVIFFAFIAFAVYVFKHIKHTQRLTGEQKATLVSMDTQSKNSLLTQKFGQALAICVSDDELKQLISKMGSHLFGKETVGALAIAPPSLDTIEIIATWGGDWPGEDRYHPKDCWGFRRGGLHLSKKDSIEVTCSHVQVDDYAMQCVPLQSHGVSLGALHIGAAPELFDSEPFQNRVNTVSEQLCLTIANLNLRKKLEQQAIRDPLTTLYNRRYLDDSFLREIKRAERKGTSLGVIMVDIDHFKVFNDTYGHDAGDYVIQQFSKLLFKTARGEDICCRYGGEEFALLLNEVDVAAVTERATELLQATRDLELQHNNQSLGQVTISLGIGMFPQHGSTQQELVKAADKALYCAKKEGRNQLKIAGDNRVAKKLAA